MSILTNVVNMYTQTGRLNSINADEHPVPRRANFASRLGSAFVLYLAVALTTSVIAVIGMWATANSNSARLIHEIFIGLEVPVLIGVPASFVSSRRALREAKKLYRLDQTSQIKLQMLEALLAEYTEEGNSLREHIALSRRSANHHEAVAELRTGAREQQKIASALEQARSTRRDDVRLTASDIWIRGGEGAANAAISGFAS